MLHCQLLRCQAGFFMGALDSLKLAGAEEHVRHIFAV